MIRIISSVLILAFVVIFAACNDNSISSSKDIVFPDKDVSYINHVYPLMKLNCSYGGCHSDETAAGGIVMTTYTSFFMTPGLVVIGNPTGSRLIQVLEDKVPHMTYFYRGNINQNHIDGMKLWIKEGAKQN